MIKIKFIKFHCIFLAKATYLEDSMVRKTIIELRAEPKDYEASLQGNRLKRSKLNISTNSNGYIEKIRIVFV